MSNKAKVLFFDTDYTAEIKDVEIKNGNIIIDNDTEHIVDDIQPMIMKSGLISNTPLYICKWNTLVPIRFQTVTKRMTADEAEKFAEDNDFVKIEHITKPKKRKGWLRNKIKNRNQNLYPTSKVEYQTPTMYEFRKLESIKTDLGKIKITPALLKETNELRFLKNMKKYASGGKDSGEGISKTKVIAIAIGSMIFGVVFMFIALYSMGIGV